MSKFIDKLNQVSQAESQPMGFGAGQPASKQPKMLLVANLAQGAVDNPADYVGGVDAGLLHISKSGSGIKTLREISGAVPDVTWGGWLRDNSEAAVKRIKQAGLDFIVFPPARTPLAVLQDDEVGKIIEVEPSISEGLLRTVSELPVDAVLIASEPTEDLSLTWHHLMLFRRFAGLLTKPLLVSIPPAVTAGELQALLEAGARGVVVEVDAEQPAGRLKELRQVIDKLTPPSPLSQRRTEALLPYPGRERNIVAEEEE